MRISDWSSDVCSSDLQDETGHCHAATLVCGKKIRALANGDDSPVFFLRGRGLELAQALSDLRPRARRARIILRPAAVSMRRSEEHTSELQSLMRISYAVFCLKKKNTTF